MFLSSVITMAVISKENRKPAYSKSPKPISLAFSNIRGLRSNFVSVESFLLNSSPDILALSETNLNSSICSADFAVNGYLPLIRKDSDRHMHGLGIYVRDSLPISRELHLESGQHYFICLRLALLHSTSYIFFLYRSPSSNDCSVLNAISTSIDTVLQSHPTANIIVCGDFNAHHTQWLNSLSTDVPGVESYNFSIAQSLSQIVNFPTRFPDHDNHSPSLLDLCLVSDPSIYSVAPLSPLGNSDHAVVSVSFSPASVTSCESPSHRTSYNYPLADWDSFRDFLSGIPWHSVFSLPADQCASEIMTWIQAGIDAFVPHRRYQVKPHSSPWFSPACAAAIAHRNHYFHLYRRDDSLGNKRLFVNARNHCKRVLGEAKARYAEATKTRISTQKLGSKEFWKIFNSVFRRSKSSIPPLFDGFQVLTSSKDKAEILARSFASNCSLDDSGKHLPNFHSRCANNIPDLRITASSVAAVLSGLDPSTASGPDNIPVIVLQKCSPELSSILSKLFNKCLSESCFPSCWKCPSVVPVFKNSGDRSDHRNYRPISLLPIISKVFERLLNNHIVAHLEAHHLFSDKQYGFRKSRSTADLLTVISERFYRALDRLGEVRAVALDISKAFDRVWHAGLLHKLRSYGISGKLLDIISSFLRDRKIKVVIDGQSSSIYCINSGVPQGSILGPILFLLYINDLPDSILCDIAIFADDTSLYSCLEYKPSPCDQSGSATNLQLDLTSVVDWGAQWLVSFNAAKTKLLTISKHKSDNSFPVHMSGAPLPEHDSFKLLGLTFSKDLSWGQYIQSIAKVAAMKVGSFYRARSYLSPEAILHLYKTIVRPCMEYCCHLWSGAPACYLDLLDRIQRRVENIIGPTLASKLQPLAHRRDVASLSLFYRYFNNRCSDELSSLVPPLKVFGRSTRLASNAHPHTVSIPVSRKSIYSRSFFPRTSKLWNSLPSTCFPVGYDLNSFKSSVNRHLISIK